MPTWEGYLPHDLDAERVAACVGLISDTHLPERCAALPAPVLDILSGVAMILHAGDVGALSVMDHRGALAPVIAVHGNDETVEAQRDDGRPYFAHVDLASPARPFEPRLDWAAGFQNASRQFNASLLAPELAAAWDGCRETAQLAPKPWDAALLRVAHRCWSGAQSAITGIDLLAELQSDPTIPATLLARFAAAVDRTP